MMIDATNRSFEEISPEDREWAQERIPKLREISHQMSAIGQRSMAVGVIYCSRDEDLCEYAPNELETRANGYRSAACVPDMNHPYCYRLKGRAAALVKELERLRLRVHREMIGPADIVHFLDRPDGAIVQESMSARSPADSRCFNLRQLLLIASW